MGKLYKPLKGGAKGRTPLDPASRVASKDPSAQSEVLEQDLFVPLSENLIIGFFFDMIHDFPESSVMTNDSKTDVEYLIMVFDSVFGGYWPECGYTLRQIIRYFNEQHGYVEAPETPPVAPKRGRDGRQRAAAATASAANARLAQQEGKGKGSKKNYLSAAGIIEKAHGFFYDLITRQGENSGVLTFDYDSKTKSGEPVSAKNKSVITSVKKIAGGGGGLPSNYFFGGFLDHQVRVQSMLQANTTTANVFKTYSDARDGANIQSFTEAAIKAINLGSPPDYTDALGSWEQQAPTDANEQRGGDGESQDSDFGSDASSVAPGSNTTLASRGDEDPTGMNRLADNGDDNSVSKPMFVVEDALKSATQLPATFSLNNRFVFSVGEGNKFNLVPIKSTAERYDAAAKKLQTPPELYDKGIKAREELLERIATKQASCYDYFYRKFNLRFGTVSSEKLGIPVATQDQRGEWKDFVTVSIGPNKLYFKDTANLVSKMATGSNIIGAMSDDDVLDYNGRKDWAIAFVKYLVQGTEKASTLFTNQEVMNANIMEGQPGTKEEIADIQGEISASLKAKDTQHIETIDSELPLDYLYNFSFYATKEAKTTDFIPYGDEVLFPSYYAQMQRIHNIRGQRQTLAAQLKGITNEWLLNRLKVYQVNKEALMAEFQKVVGEQLFEKKPKAKASEVNPKSLFFPTGATSPSWSKFITFLLLRQEKASKPIDNKSVQNYVSLLWKDVVPEVEGNAQANQIGLSIKMVLTVVFNLRLAELCMRRIAIESIRTRETAKKDNSGLNEAIWVPTIDLYLTDIVMQGCSNNSKMVVSPSGTRDSETVEINVSGDSEQDVKSGASVAAVLNKWRTQIIDEVFAKGNKSDTKGACAPQSGSKKETAAERSCIETHSGDYQAQLKCLSGTAGMSRTAPMHDCLANWLQTVVGKAALEPNSLKRGAGFTPQDLRKSFGELFQKTVGDFFQVKVAQFLNDTMDCFTCEGGKCASDSSAGTFGRYTYRPYSENPNGPVDNGLLVAADAFYRTYKRPIVASTVQLNTFDVMAGLIGLQQSANVVLQTIAKTTRSPGTALYGISNLSAPVREYIETKLGGSSDKTYTPTTSPMEQDEEDEPKQNNADTSVDPGEEGDEEDGVAKEVDTSKLQMVDVDIDLISVIRKTPAIITNVEEMLVFLNQNRLAGVSLTDTLQKTYSQLATDTYEPASVKQWVFTLRLLFDNLCYYKQMRPEEALTRAKVVTYILKLLQSHPPASAKANEILDAFVQTVDVFKASNADEGLEMDIAVVPIFPKEFVQALEMMNNASKSGDDAMTKQAFSEIIDLMQKTSGDKKIAQAVGDTNEETDSYEKYTSSWMQMFKKVNMQNQEIEAVDALLMLSGLRDNPQEGAETDLYESEDEEDMEQDEEDAATSMSFFGNDTDMDSDEDESDEESDDTNGLSPITAPVPKKPRTSGGSRRHRKRLPKHRTIRKHSGGQKTLTQVLKELTLGI